MVNLKKKSKIPQLGNKFEVIEGSITQLDKDILNGLLGYFDKVTPFAKEGSINRIVLEKSGVKYAMDYTPSLCEDSNDLKFIIVRKEKLEEIQEMKRKEYN